MDYVTLDEINLFLSTSGEDTLMEQLADIAESHLHAVLRIDGFLDTEYTEYYLDKCNNNNFFITRQLNPTSLASINDVVVTSDDYLFTGRKLDLDTTYTPDKWGRIKLIYNAGYATVPEDVKTLVLTSIGGLYNKRKSVGIQNFTQGQLSVSFRSSTDKDNFSQMYNSLLSKYKKNDIYV